jgi:membrane protein
VSARAGLELLKETIAGWNADKAPRLAAAIAYTTIFAIAPLLIVTIAIVGALLGFTGAAHPHSAVETQLLAQISHAAGPDAALMVRGMVDGSFAKPRQNIIAQVLGWITFVIGASSVFAALQDALNTVWDAQPPARHANALAMIRDRVVSLGMLVGVGFLLMVSFLLNILIAYASANLTRMLPLANAGAAFAAVNWIVSVLVIAALFALIFRVLPDVDISWKDVEIGAFFTALLFVLGQALIGIYIGKAAVASAYGAAGALLAVLIWIYYSAAILLLGAEFTKVYARRNARKGKDTVPLHAA